MREQPTTPEGHLIRFHRESLTPPPTQPQMAQRLGWTTGKWIAAELGRTRARRGNPAAEYHASDADLVRIAAELGITPDELETAGRPHAAERLRASLAAEPRPGQDPAPAILAAADRFLRAVIADRRDRDGEFLSFIARDIDGDGNLRPLAERLNEAAEWIANHPARASQGIRKTG